MTLLSNLVTLLAVTATGLTGADAAAIERRAGSKGCGRSHNFVGQTKEFGFQSNGGYRSYRIHLPSNYDTTTPKPLMLAFHGAGNNPANFEKETRFSDEGINPNMITVYPAGLNGVWQGASYSNEGVSDKVFTSDLVQRIKDNYCVDDSRVYAAGHSNGAGFVDVLACSPEHGGQFAAFAPVSGAFYSDLNNDHCHPARSPLPMFEVHGTGDQTIPYTGGSGRGGQLPKIPDWVDLWKGRNQCTGPDTKDNGAVHDYQYTCHGISDLLRHIKIDGQSHAWPGPGSAIDISPVIIKWLNNNYKP